MTEIESNDIKEIVEVALDREVEDFSMAQDFYEHYGMDSLGAVALVVEVQKRFDVRIPDDRMPEVRTGEQLKAVIKSLSQADIGQAGSPA